MSTYITYKNIITEIELKVQNGKKEVEDGWINTASL